MGIVLGPQEEFKDKNSSAARTVIEPHSVKAEYEPILRTGFPRRYFYSNELVSITAQSVTDLNSIKTRGEIQRRTFKYVPICD
jgi:hypothetical protein